MSYASEMLSKLPVPVPDVRAGWTSASNASADAACPGRHLAQKGILEPESSKDAAHGDAIHAALCSRNPDGLTVAQRDTYDACCEIESKLYQKLFGSVDTEDRQTVRETRWWLDTPSGWFRHSGQLDVVHRVGNEALVCDYKTLPGEVASSPTNEQLRDHAVLVRYNMPGVVKVHVAIIQPMVTRNPLPCTYGPAELEVARDLLYARVIASNNVNSKRVPGEVQCKHCLAAKAGKCVEWQKWAGQITPPALLTVLEVPMANWTPEQRSFAQTCVKQARKLCDDIEEFNKQGIAAHGESFCPGWFLRPGAVHETITDPETVFERFIGIGGDPKAFMRCVKIAKGGLKEQVAAVSGAKGMALNAALATMVKGCVKESQNKPSLKRKGDDSD